MGFALTRKQSLDHEMQLDAFSTRGAKMKTTTLLLTLTLLLGACASSPHPQQKAASVRPSEIDVGNVNSSIVGTINPANLGQ
jgi:starvation-inducible outer membrane lipoprotein